MAIQNIWKVLAGSLTIVGVIVTMARPSGAQAPGGTAPVPTAVMPTKPSPMSPPAQPFPAPPAKSEAAPTARQVMIEDYSSVEYESDIGVEGGNMFHPPLETVGEPSTLFTVSLQHISAEGFLSEMYSAIVPGAGFVICKNHATARNFFCVGGLHWVIPVRKGNKLLMYGTMGAYGFLKTWVRLLDRPKPSHAATQKISTVQYGFRRDSYGNADIEFLVGIIPLSHTTPDAVIAQLNSGYIPSNGIVTVGPSETLANAAGTLFGPEDVELIVPDRQTNSLLVCVSKEGLIEVEQILRGLGVIPVH